MDHADEGVNNDVFIYTGGSVPQHLRDTITHVRVHQSVKIIARGAFWNCRNLVSIEIHDGVEIIGREAFWGCESLRGIKLTGVRVVGDSAFWTCKALERVEFGNKLETIGCSAFGGTALRSVKIPKVRVIKTCAFWDCEKLTVVELSEDLERIEDNVFGFSYCLRYIAMPLKDDLLGDRVFYQCDALSQVDIVGGVHKTVSSLFLERWRNEIKDEIDRINRNRLNIPHINKTEVTQQWMETVIQRITHYKSEHCILLKEAMSLLELALWKANLDDNVGYDAAAGVRVTRGQRKRARKDRSITSGASIVIKNVLPFLKLE